jgi:hypothetical protein
MVDQKFQISTGAREELTGSESEIGIGAGKEVDVETAQKEQSREITRGSYINAIKLLVSNHGDWTSLSAEQQDQALATLTDVFDGKYTLGPGTNDPGLRAIQLHLGMMMETQADGIYGPDTARVIR